MKNLLHTRPSIWLAINLGFVAAGSATFMGLAAAILQELR